MSNFFNNLAQTFKERWPDILIGLQEHLFLSLISLTIAALIAVPLGIFISRKRRLAEPVIGVTAIFQTVPSLALFGFLLPVFGIGNTTAIIALTIYALLPILRNTYIGITGVDASAVEAGRGMGMTRNQILRMIELPLALPIIMGGLRTATVLTIGVATLAAFIGAGGLGDLIYRGLSTARNDLVLVGAIPAAILAIVCDWLLKRIEIASDPRAGKKFSMKKLAILAGLPVLALLAFFAFKGENTDDTVVIAGKKWTEQYILPHILAAYIEEKTDYKVKVEEGLGETPVLTKAIQKGDIDMYVEYTGTGLLTVLKEKYDPDKNADEIYETVKKGYAKDLDVEWMAPLGFENTFTLAVNEETYKKLGIKTISELSPRSSDLIFGGPTEYYEREDGYTPLVETYNLNFKGKESLDANLMYSAVKEGDVDVISAFTTDGRIPRFNLGILEDDKNFFPPYYAAPIVRKDTLKEFPKLKEVINELEGVISEKEMAEMNARVDLDKVDPEKVAREFLKKKGIIK